MRRTNALIAAALLLALMPAAADDKSGVVSWETLAQVSVTRQKDRYVPEFSKQILALDQREVKLQGFMMPLEPGLAQTHFLLSAQPPDCAFCMPGTAEQFAEVRAKVPVKVPSDVIVVSGKFSLVRDDSGGLLYRLTEAVVVNK
jgi:Protein of unknown function (DUF3299).